MNLTLEVPINSVSFGNVSISILRELYKRKLDINTFEIGQSDLSAQNEDVGFAGWLQNSINNSRLNHNKNNNVFKLWHIIQSMSVIKGASNSLFTFHETSQISEFEKSALDIQDLIFVSSDYTKEVFESSGVNTKIISCPLGFDSFNVKKLNKKFYSDDRIVWGLCGKMEERKSTLQIIKVWAKKFGNNRKHILHLLINNHFVNQAYKDNEATRKLLIQALDGKNYNNIVWYDSIPKNSDLNDWQNCLDIDLGGLSKLEGWGIPYFNSLCLGKHGVALNAHANKMFANNENSILIEPNGMVPAEDGLFFIKGAPQNQGNWFSVSDDDIISAMEIVAQKAKTPNPAGEKLKDIFTMGKMVDTIINNIS